MEKSGMKNIKEFEKITIAGQTVSHHMKLGMQIQGGTGVYCALFSSRRSIKKLSKFLEKRIEEQEIFRSMGNDYTK